jgi:hypothetical protein
MAEFAFWNTEKLGSMLALARLRLREAQARFEASGEAERRMRRKHTFEAEQDEEHVRRAEDTLELMRAELRRRAVECCVEDEVA